MLMNIYYFIFSNLHCRSAQWVVENKTPYSKNPNCPFSLYSFSSVEPFSSSGSETAPSWGIIPLPLHRGHTTQRSRLLRRNMRMKITTRIPPAMKLSPHLSQIPAKSIKHLLTPPFRPSSTNPPRLPHVQSPPKVL